MVICLTVLIKLYKILFLKIKKIHKVKLLLKTEQSGPINVRTLKLLLDISNKYFKVPNFN